MGVEGEEPTSAQVAEMRAKISDYIAENGKDVFDARDVNRFMREDFYVARFYMHVYDEKGDQVELAIKVTINTFQWRKETGIADLTADDFSDRIKQRGTLFSRNRDKDNKKLLVFDVKKHAKGAEKMDDMKKFFLYHIERIDREERGDKLTLVFDCANSGLKNMDMDFIQYMIDVFKNYCPYSLNYILVLDMPWVLNAAWKIIKTWLPAAAVKKIKFLTKSTVSEYVEEDQRFLAWDGTDDWEYEFVPEEKPRPTVSEKIAIPEPSSSSKRHASGDRFMSMEAPEEKRKSNKVHFASSPPSESSFSQDSGVASGTPSRSNSFNVEKNSANLLRLNPSDEVVFNKLPQGEIMAKVEVTNITDKTVVFKIKTTSPDKYRVRPSAATLAPGASNSVEIHVQSSQGVAAGIAPSSLLKDKFLVTAVTVDHDGLTLAQVSDVLKSSKPEAQYRLRCTMAGMSAVSASSDLPLAAAAVVVRAGTAGLDATAVQPQQQNKQLEVLTKKVTSLNEAVQKLRDDVSFLRTMLIILVVLACVQLVLLFWRTSGNAAIPASCPETVVAAVVGNKDL